MARTVRAFLVVNSAGDVRLAKRPRIALDEVCVALNINYPDGWGKQVGEIDISLPDPPTIEEVLDNG